MYGNAETLILHGLSSFVDAALAATFNGRADVTGVLAGTNDGTAMVLTRALVYFSKEAAKLPHYISFLRRSARRCTARARVT